MNIDVYHLINSIYNKYYDGELCVEYDKYFN